MSKLLGLAALFGVGLLLAGVVPSQGGADTTTVTTTEPAETSTEQVTTTVQQTTTAPAITVVTTATLPLTTTPTTTATENTSSGTPTWVWILVAALGAAVIGLLVYALTRHGSGPLPETERRLRLQGAIDSWTAQGWALLSESADTAVLQRGNERMTVTVDPTGHVSTRAMTPPPPPDQPTERWPE